VCFADQALEAELDAGQISETTIDRYCRVWLAGAAAEHIVVGSVEGAGDDRQKVSWLLSRCAYSAQQRKTKESWAAMQAKSMIEQHRTTYDRLVVLFREKAPLDRCHQVVRESLG
jgi:hypothetical protein